MVKGRCYRRNLHSYHENTNNHESKWPSHRAIPWLLGRNISLYTVSGKIVIEAEVVNRWQQPDDQVYFNRGLIELMSYMHTVPQERVVLLHGYLDGKQGLSTLFSFTRFYSRLFQRVRVAWSLRRCWSSVGIRVGCPSVKDRSGLPEWGAEPIFITWLSLINNVAWVLIPVSEGNEPSY